MTTYEIIMVVLTFLSLLIAVDAKNRKKRAEPAFTSAEVRHASKYCTRGRFYAIPYTLK